MPGKTPDTYDHWESLSPQKNGELFPFDTPMVCGKCCFIAYNDTLNCVQWCVLARKCVGEEMYVTLLKTAAVQKGRK